MKYLRCTIFGSASGGHFFPYLHEANEEEGVRIRRGTCFRIKYNNRSGPLRLLQNVT